MAPMSFETEHEGMSSNLKVSKEEENMSYNKEITLRDNEKLEKLNTMKNDTQIWETLVVKEYEPTSLESDEKW